MTLPFKTQFIAYGTIVIATIGGTIFAIVTYWSPRLSEHHHAIAQNQAAVAAIQRQQQDLSGLAQQLADRQEEQAKINKELWAFSEEATFYDIWDPLGATTQTEITLDSIADATPSEVPVRRDASITITGTWTNVWRAIAQLPDIDPMTVIQDFRFTPGITSTAVVARLTLATLWYDDTLQ